MSSPIPSLLALAHSRITEFELDAKSSKSRYNHFYHWPQTYIEWLHDEIAEVEAEIRAGNHVLLEDELGDVFWDYICLLESLHQQGYISSVTRPLERAEKKFSERIEAARDESRHSDIGWQEVKTRQKEELREEMNWTLS